MWRRATDRADSRISKRLSRLAEPDLVAWADQAIYSTGRYLTAYQRERVPQYLDEARSGAEALLAVIEEIRRREGS